MNKRTALYSCHLQAQAKMTDFAGWDMPLHYGSQLKEHQHVRKQAGVFDVSHMGIVDIKGANALAFLRYILANDIDRIPFNKALYTCLLNEQGGIIDDLIVYKVQEDFCRLVVNAGTREKDLAWLQHHATPFNLNLIERTDLAMLAVQGPAVIASLPAWLNDTQVKQIGNLKPFTFNQVNDWFIARTGYTGEDGFEIILPASGAPSFWQQLLTANIMPCGLAARDTLRLEAGLNLYGMDMDETVTPFECNLAWTVALEPEQREFIGKIALLEQLKQGVKQKLVGLLLQGAGIMRHGQAVYCDDKVGVITSGGYSPTLAMSIALARIPTGATGTCSVAIRDKRIPAEVVKPPFVRQGKKVITE